MISGSVLDLMAGRQGLEPRYADPESAVLPLDDLPMVTNASITRASAISRQDKWRLGGGLEAGSRTNSASTIKRLGAEPT